MIPRESDFTTKQESSTISDGTKINKAAASSNNPTSSWSRLKDPRVVRVSRAFGGKDRHSKVCTIRGLRDRRVRLSVPTAIQLYDLQDRLGLNQPSKVVDWLLNVAKHEIDELPPLQIPPGAFSQNLDQPIDELRSDKQGLNINDSINWNDQSLKETSDHRDENWARNEEERQFISLQENFVSRQNPTSLLNNTIPYSSMLRWDPSSLTLSHPPRGHELTAAAQTTENLHNFSFVPMQSTMSVPSSGSHQVLVYQPGMSTQSYFPFHINAPEIDDQKQVHFQSSELSNDSSTAQPARQFHFNMTENLLPSHNGGAIERGKQRQ